MNEIYSMEDLNELPIAREKVNYLQIIHDYKVLNIPLDMLINKYKKDRVDILDILYRATVAIPSSIRDSKKLLKELT